MDERISSALVHLVAESRDEFDELRTIERQLRAASVITPLEASSIANTLANVIGRLQTLVEVTAKTTPDPAPAVSAPSSKG